MERKSSIYSLFLSSISKLNYHLFRLSTKTQATEIRLLFCYHEASESYSYGYVCQVAMITEYSLSI